MDHFPLCVSPRRKVVSGFSLRILGSLVVLVIVLFTISFNNVPLLVTPMFQGFNSTWPFSFSTCSTISSSSFRNHIDEANVSLIGKNRNFSGFSRKGEVLEKAHVENLPKKVNAIEKGGIWVKGLFGNGSIVGKNAIFNNGSQKGELVKEANIEKVANLTIWEKTHKGKKVENRTKGVVVAKNKVFEKDNVTNFKISGESVGLFKDRDFRLVKGGVKCDIFHGRWVRNEKKPYYSAGSCPYIDRDFDCYFNGRPDDRFLKWRWQPYDCDIPSLNATDFLERLRGKKLVFVGDSLNRNMWESLVCVLRDSIRNKKKVYEISGRRDFKKKGFYAFRFEDYNCSVDFVSSPFLVRESSSKGKKGYFETLRLDLMDRTTSMYRDADIVVFNTGHWWTHEKTSRGEDYYQEGSHVYPSLKVLEAYTKALRTWARWVDAHIDSKRAQVVFRGYSLTHFRSGQWNSGGQCHKETDPIFNETYLSNYPTKMKALEHTIQEMKTPVIYLNISRLTDYRKDAHPSIYRKKYNSIQEKIDGERSQDCSHWCLPGVPDTWNELLYVSLLQSGKSSWRS